MLVLQLVYSGGHAAWQLPINIDQASPSYARRVKLRSYAGIAAVVGPHDSDCMSQTGAGEMGLGHARSRVDAWCI